VTRLASMVSWTVFSLFILASTRCRAVRTWFTVPLIIMMRSLVPGKYSLVRDSWMRASLCVWNSARVCRGGCHDPQHRSLARVDLHWCSHCGRSEAQQGATGALPDMLLPPLPMTLPAATLLICAASSRQVSTHHRLI